jgi:hypothetical protein
LGLGHEADDLAVRKEYFLTKSGDIKTGCSLAEFLSKVMTPEVLCLPMSLLLLLMMMMMMMIIMIQIMQI